MIKNHASADVFFNENDSLHIDPLNQYLRDIGKIPRITVKEEIELAVQIKNGNAEAREKMINTNLRLVVKIACRYEGMGLQLLDLINEGNIGLMKAVERFRPGRGAKFSTYGSHWIKQSIRRALMNHSRDIRMPVHMFEKISRMNRAENQLRDELDRLPSDEELAERLGVKSKKVRKMKTMSIPPIHLDSPIGDGNDHTIADIISDDSAVDPSEDSCRCSDFDRINMFLSELNPRDREIVDLRFGFSEGGKGLTLEEIGAKFGVTRERIRQIQTLILNKLKRRMNGSMCRSPVRKNETHK